MLRVVVVHLLTDAPGKCFTGFTDKDHIFRWLKEKGFDQDNWRWIIFDEMQTRHI